MLKRVTREKSPAFAYNSGNIRLSYCYHGRHDLKKFDDYSGDLIHNLRPTDFSHEALEKLITTYARLYMAMDGFWYLTVMERSGNDEAAACDIKVWDKLASYEMKHLKRAFNIEGDQVLTLLKCFQLTPWAWNLKTEFEIFNNNHGIMKVLHCPTVDVLEREGKGREDSQCNIIEVSINQAYARAINPGIKVTRLTSPPRKNKVDPYCTWEFKLES